MEKVLELPAERIFTKQRKPQKGKEQYEKVDTRQHERIVQEGGLKFIVNLSDYLDTGLFLDHRPNRELVRTQAKDKRVLNLFAYTGSFTVYAAAAGAASTLTIDLSNTYLDWAQRNLELNGLEGPQHRFLRADVLQWLEQPVRETYDIIILDPPTFSNSKAMLDVLDVQRDHPGMIRACARRLGPGGVLYFSTNFRKFKMEVEELEGFEVKDITAQSIPNDFRNSRIHYCWAITRV
jgi:23S rRNA G2069 N7-methylase RlmK/C1962 C5-methylase RlmI